MEADGVARLPRLPRVAVCGGTHGNELSGVYLVREMARGAAKQEAGAEVLTMLGNPRAAQACRRYANTDLNRCFTHAVLNGPESEEPPYEIRRARELNRLLGPKGSRGAVDLVCDLHNTTANMGLCLIAYSDRDWVCLHIFMHLQRSMPDVPMRFIHYNLACQESYSLDSVGKHGFAMEIGPQPHGVVRSNIFTLMKTGVQHVLDWVRLFNSGAVFEGGSVEVYTMVRSVDYPRDGETRGVAAAVHPQLQDRDFCLLRPGDPLFQTFSGETLPFQSGEPLYPFFINEGAYYEKGIAVSLARRRRVAVPAVRALAQGEEREFTSEEEE